MAAAAGMLWLDPIAAPVALAALAHAWIIPELYAFRGRDRRPRRRAARDERAERGRAGPARRPARPRRARAPARHRPRARARRARRLARRARPARCWSRPAAAACTASASPRPTRELPPSDRVAHLLLALRDGRGGLRDGGQPRLRRRALAGAPAPAGARCGPALDAAPARGASSASSARGLRRRHRRRGVRRAVRGAPARAPAAAPQRAHHCSSPTSTSCSTRRCCRAPPPGTLEPRHVVVPLREELECTDIRLGRVTGRRPGARRARRTTTARRPRRDAPLRPADRRARLGLARAAGARPRRARPRLQDARRRDRAAQPRAAEPRDRRVAAGRRGARASTSPSCSSARATRAWRASPSCRTTWPT